MRKGGKGMKKRAYARTKAAAEGKVPGVMENAKICLCMQCPVQTESTCAKSTMKDSEKLVQAGAGQIKGPADIPKLYCATGIAACKDIDTNQMCICGDCPVWKKYDLQDTSPSMYFCRDGKAL